MISESIKNLIYSDKNSDKHIQIRLLEYKKILF